MSANAEDGRPLGQGLSGMKFLLFSDVNLEIFSCFNQPLGMASEITLLDEMFKVEEVDSGRYDRGTFILSVAAL